MVMAYDNARRRHGAMTFLLRVVTISEICEELKPVWRNANTPAVNGPPAVIPAEHSARLIALGYMVDLAGRLRMTTPGRIRIYAGQLAS
jgi:hypothetical protein